MEPSQANRLPEVDSLPDGFVEPSADPSAPTPSPLKDAAPEVESAQVAVAAQEGVADGSGTPDASLQEGEGLAGGESGGSGGGAAEGPPGAMPQSGDANCCGSVRESEGTGCAEQEKETKGSLELCTSQVTEGSAERPTTKKADASETKRKAGKRGTKSEKEFLELTLKYHKVVAERDAAIAVREKLESLCRELQRQNKMLLEECQRVSTEGQNMRSDLSTRFNNAINDVSIKLEEQKDECIAQLKENEMLREKIKHLADQYALSEQQFEQKLKQKTLELQLADLKLQQHMEKSVEEQSQMQVYAEQVKQLLETEKSLRLQLAADGEKFQQFQDALLKSNEVFETFKQEIEKMTKLIKDLKAENAFLKSKCEKSDFSLIKLVEEREATKKQMEKLKNQKEKLESLCRSLQAERKQKSLGSDETNSVPAHAHTDVAVDES